MRSRRGRDEREERALSLLASDCLRRGKNDGEKTEREEAVGLPFFSFASFTFFPLQPRRETLSNLLPHSLARARAESLRAMPQQPKGATTDPRRRWLASRVRECWPLCVLGLCRSFPLPLFSLNPPPAQKKLFQLSDAFSLPLAEATAAVDCSSSAVDAFFDGKSSSSSETGENQDNESLAWFYQPRVTTTTTTKTGAMTTTAAAAAAAATAELFLSDLSVKAFTSLFARELPLSL